jgi:hypothetical protein
MLRLSFASRFITAVGALCAMVVYTSQAAADVPPRPGVKQVPFSFAVDGLGVAPDRVLFAFPCGSPKSALIEHRKIEDGVAIDVGRNGGRCTVYAIARTAYDAWAKEHTQSGGPDDSAIEKLASESVRCTGAPLPIFELASSDSRQQLHQKLHVTALDAKRCVLTPEPLVLLPDGVSSPANVAASSRAVPPKPPKASRGCALGAPPTSSSAHDLGLGLGAFVTALGLIAVRRTRRARAQSL